MMRILAHVDRVGPLPVPLARPLVRRKARQSVRCCRPTQPTAARRIAEIVERAHRDAGRGLRKHSRQRVARPDLQHRLGLRLADRIHAGQPVERRRRAGAPARPTASVRGPQRARVDAGQHRQPQRPVMYGRNAAANADDSRREPMRVRRRGHGQAMRAHRAGRGAAAMNDASANSGPPTMKWRGPLRMATATPWRSHNGASSCAAKPTTAANPPGKSTASSIASRTRRCQRDRLRGVKAARCGACGDLAHRIAGDEHGRRQGIDQHPPRRRLPCAQRRLRDAIARRSARSST